MAKKNFYVDLNLNQQSIMNGKWEQIAGNPASPFEGQEWCDTVTGERKVYKGGQVVVYASQSWVTEQVNMIERSQGGFDANPGVLPALTDKTRGDLTAFQIGDYWVVNNAGTITGIQGDDVLSIGDKIEYLGGTPTDPNNWLGIQRNLDDNLLGNTVVDRQTVALAAGTDLTVSSSIVADIHSIQIYDSTGTFIELYVKKTANPNERIITSSVALSGVVVELTGASS